MLPGSMLPIPVCKASWKHRGVALEPWGCIDHSWREGGWKGDPELPDLAGTGTGQREGLV